MLKFSTYEQAFDELLENEGLKKKAAKSGISYGTLKKVYNRGMAAWRTGHRPGTTPQQWGMARVNSYIGKGKGTYYGADADLSGKGKKKKESYGEATVKEISKSTLDRYIKKADIDKSKKHVRADVGKISRDDAYKNQVKRNKGIELAKSKMKSAKVAASEATVKEISKKTAAAYISKASRDTYQLGQRQGAANAIAGAGGTHPDQNYKGGPERKAVRRVVGIDRAARRLQRKEGMSDAEKAAHQKAIDAFKAKGGKIKKLKPGYAQGYHGKADPAAGMKGMMDKGDTRSIGTRKKVGSMK